MIPFKSLVIACALAGLTFCSQADAQPMQYPSNGTYNYDRYGTSSTIPYSYPPVSNRDYRYDNVPYSSQLQNRSSTYNSNTNSNDRRYDSYFPSTRPVGNDSPNSLNRSRTSSGYVQSSDSRFPPILDRNVQPQNKAPYRPSTGIRQSLNDDRIFNSSYDRNGSYDRNSTPHRGGVVVPSTLTRPSTNTQRGIAQNASDLYTASNAICWEMERYYKQNANYTAVYRDVYQIKEVAKRLKATVGQQNGRITATDSRVVSALHDMDRQFHEFEADVSRWRPTSGYTPRTQLAAMIRECEDSLHDVMKNHGIDTRYHEAASRQSSGSRRDDSRDVRDNRRDNRDNRDNRDPRDNRRDFYPNR